VLGVLGRRRAAGGEHQGRSGSLAKRERISSGPLSRLLANVI
jgi:hypothetical protein